MLEKIVGFQYHQRCLPFRAFFVNARIVESKLGEEFQIILRIFKIRRQQDSRLEIPDRPVGGGDVITVSSANGSANGFSFRRRREFTDYVVNALHSVFTFE